MTISDRGALPKIAVLAALLVATPAMASFQAADLIYIPAVAKTTGSGTSNWKTDIDITNVDEVAIDVAMVYLPSGLVSNSSYFIDRTYWLGGREDDGFGFLNMDGFRAVEATLAAYESARTGQTVQLG